MANNYYISSFTWSTVAKIFNAAVNFFSIPVLLGLWGQSTYGVLALATACNGYMHLMDLGLNTGAIRYFSIWISENKYNHLHRVANSNTIFYSLVSIVNILCLLIIAFFGENWFKLTHDEFLVLRNCMFILAVFSLPTWITTSFNQLLVANKQIVYTQIVNCFITLLKGLLIGATILFRLEIVAYFSLFTAIVAITLLPYMYKCIQNNLYGRFHFRFYWNDFKPVLYYSLALFALSIFQVTATQSRPIILGVFSANAADVLAEYRIIEVIPLFILAIGGSITSILLPKSSMLIAADNREGINRFAYSGTKITSILACCLTFPFIIGAKDILSSYVGIKYSYLSTWLIVWSVTILIQIHTTPGNSLILAYGKTKPLVYTSAIGCVISMAINAALCRYYGVGSAVVGYLVYVIFVIGSYYVIYYDSILRLSRIKMFTSFIYPSLIGVVSLVMATILSEIVFGNLVVTDKLLLFLLFAGKSFIWLMIYSVLILSFKIIKIQNRHLVY